MFVYGCSLYVCIYLVAFTLEPLFSLKNGRTVSVDIFNDRGFCYGDGFFETIRMNYGRAELWSLHCERIVYSAKRLGFLIDIDELQRIYKQASVKLLHISHAVLKLQFTRQQFDSQGSYGSKSASSNIYALAKTFSPRDYGIGATLVLSDVPLPDNALLSGVKSLNRLSYILAANAINYQKSEQVVFFRANGDLVETMHHNIFLVIGDDVFTPCLSLVGVNGVMRSHVLSILRAEQRNVNVVSGLTKKDLFLADEVFITNALDGVVPVAYIHHAAKKNIYSCRKLSEQLTNQLSGFYGQKEQGVK